MRKILFAFVAVLLVVFVGCKGSSKYAAKAVIVSYSQSGNTDKLIPLIQRQVWADVISLKVKSPYPTDYAALVATVRNEIESGTNPQLQQGKFDLDRYDTVYLAYPIWFGTFARPIRTFLDSNDLSGKVIIPFCTYGSGGLEQSVRDIKGMERGATVLDGYGISQKRLKAGYADVEIQEFFERMNDTREGRSEKTDYTDFRTLYADDSLLFKQAMEDYAYLKMTPKSVATQVTETNKYKFVVDMTEPNGITVEAYVNIVKPKLEGGDVQMISVEKISK